VDWIEIAEHWIEDEDENLSEATWETRR